MHETAILLHTSNRGKKCTREGKKGAREGKKGAREGKKGAAPFYFGLAGTLYKPLPSICTTLSPLGAYLQNITVHIIVIVVGGEMYVNPGPGDVITTVTVYLYHSQSVRGVPTKHYSTHLQFTCTSL